ncbi:MAG: CopG family transcriptional regulator [Nanoarchaeota archaeon]|nr:CopG family transcriptional regulator [Nanoarchaeota archaeon]MBU4086441.1 CopG family transcriptional regulator [Nanoarchaeota archaeon]
MKKRINVTIDEKIIGRFQDYCKENAMKVSSKIELLILEELKNEK